MARAFERAGDPASAADALARTAAASPREQEVLAALDRLTRGGVDPRAPWPAERGDGWRTGRSRARGPTRGATVERRSVLASVATVRGFAVDARGRVVLAAGCVLDPLASREALDLVPEPGGRPLPLLTERAEPGVGPGGRGASLAAPPSLLGNGVVVGEGRASAEVSRRDVVAAAALSSPWLAAPGHLVGARGRQGLEARTLASPRATAWTAVLPRAPARLALAPGARLLALTEGGLGARGSLHLFDLATGRAARPVSLENVGLRAGKDLANVIASEGGSLEDGSLFLGLGGSVAALAPDGTERWRWPHLAEPAVLAGENQELLVVCDPRSFAPVAIDARTGKKVWESRDACLNGLPKVDARGVVYWRRETELVWLDTATGQVAGSAVVGENYWEFAFAGDGRAYALRPSVRGSLAELVVVE